MVIVLGCIADGSWCVGCLLVVVVVCIGLGGFTVGISVFACLFLVLHFVLLIVIVYFG